MGNVREVTDGSFKADVLDASVPVLVDFWAPWCPPCRAIAPVIEEVATELGDTVRIVKMNVDDNFEIPNRLGIRSIPTLKLFFKGNEVNQMVGAASKDQIKAFISSHSTN